MIQRLLQVCPLRLVCLEVRRGDVVGARVPGPGGRRGVLGHDDVLCVFFLSSLSPWCGIRGFSSIARIEKPTKKKEGGGRKKERERRDGVSRGFGCATHPLALYVCASVFRL